MSIKKNILCLHLCALFALAISNCNALGEISPESDRKTPSITQEAVETSLGSETPTLSITQTSTTVDDFSVLGDNQCSLPCWRGIVPGKSSIAELGAITQNLIGVSPSQESGTFQNQQYFSTDAYKSFMSDKSRIGFSIGSFSHFNQNIIEVLDIQTYVLEYEEADESKGQSSYWRLFQKYSLQNVLTEYGQPSQVMIFAEMYREEFLQERESLYLRLLYPAKGIYVSYDMPLGRNGDKGIACPSNADFSLWLTSPDLSEFYEPWWEGSQGYTNFSATFDTPIEEALGMNIDSFYDIFSKENAPCFTTPIKIWLP